MARKKKLRLPKLVIDVSRYPILLTYPEWLKKRDQILRRDKYRCTNCYSNIRLNVHHLHYQYFIFPWEHDDTSMITLCETCHKLFHDRKENEFCITPEQIEELKSVLKKNQAHECQNQKYCSVSI